MSEAPNAVTWIIIPCICSQTDILLLTMDTTSVKKSTADDKNLDEVSRSKRKKTIKEEVEREVNLEDYQEVCQC